MTVFPALRAGVLRHITWPLFSVRLMMTPFLCYPLPHFYYRNKLHSLTNSKHLTIDQMEILPKLAALLGCYSVHRRFTDVNFVQASNSNFVVSPIDSSSMCVPMLCLHLIRFPLNPYYKHSKTASRTCADGHLSLFNRRKRKRHSPINI